MMKKLIREEEGFSLVELIVVIAVLGVLAALLVPRILGNVDDSRKSSALTDAKIIANEITVANVNQMLEDNTLIIPSPTPSLASGWPYVVMNVATVTDMERIGRTNDDLPNSEYVQIHVESGGSAYIVEKGSPNWKD